MIICSDISLTDWISAIATALTFLVALGALFTWRYQKKFELKIEIFALSRVAFDLLQSLRNPNSHVAELDQELLNSWSENGNRTVSSTEWKYIAYRSRLKGSYADYKQMMNLRERIWAYYGDNHLYHQYYDFILTTIIKVDRAHSELLELSDITKFPGNEFKKERNLKRKITSARNGDEIENELQMLFDKMSKKR